MISKVTFARPDEILGAIVRALAVQAAGFQVAGGMNAEYLKRHGFYRFEFSKKQSDRFEQMFTEYVPDKFRTMIQIAEE